MELIKDKPELLIYPDPKLSDRLIKEIIENKSVFSLDDSIKEELTHQPLGNKQPTFIYKGIYPYHFTSVEDAKDFKQAVDQLIDKTNNTPGHIKIKKIDDLLFISLLYWTYDGEVYGATNRELYLDELADVLVKLANRKTTATDDSFVFFQNQFTGIETPIEKSLLSHNELIENGGFHVYSRHIGRSNRIINIPNDGKITINGVNRDDQPIELSSRLSKQLIKMMVNYIIAEHKREETPFYESYSKEHVPFVDWEERNKPKKYERRNKKLKMIIAKLDENIKILNIGSKTSQRHIFIYNFLALIKLMPLPFKLRAYSLPIKYTEQIQFHQLMPSEKSTAIRAIIRDN